MNRGRTTHITEKKTRTNTGNPPATYKNLQENRKESEKKQVGMKRMAGKKQTHSTLLGITSRHGTIAQRLSILCFFSLLVGVVEAVELVKSLALLVGVKGEESIA